MRKFGKRRMCALLCGLSSVFCDFGQALAMKGTGAIDRKLRKQNMIGKNVDMRKIDNGKVVKVVEKNQVKKTFAEKGYEWVMNNKKKSLLLTALWADCAWRGINEIRLSTIYKKLDKHYENGGGSASVERYVYRNKENSKNLVIKSISHWDPVGNYVSFPRERFACKVIPELAKENKHLANIIDYHYGLTHNYVVYEDVGANCDWKNEMKDWSDDQKFEWLKDVITQIVGVNLFFLEKGYCYDFELDNLVILRDKNDKPLVKVVDYSLFRKNNGEFTSASNFDKLCQAFLDICCQVLGVEHTGIYGWLDQYWNAKQYAAEDKAQSEDKVQSEVYQVSLLTVYGTKPLVVAIFTYLMYKRGGLIVEEKSGKDYCIKSDEFKKVLIDFRNKINQKDEKK